MLPEVYRPINSVSVYEERDENGGIAFDIRKYTKS